LNLRQFIDNLNNKKMKILSDMEVDVISQFDHNIMRGEIAGLVRKHLDIRNEFYFQKIIGKTLFEFKGWVCVESCRELHPVVFEYINSADIRELLNFTFTQNIFTENGWEDMPVKYNWNESEMEDLSMDIYHSNIYWK